MPCVWQTTCRAHAVRRSSEGVEVRVKWAQGLPFGGHLCCISRPAVHIAYVTETFPPEINGVSLTAERTLRHLRGAGHRVQLVRPRQRGEPPLDAQHECRTYGGPIPMYPDLRYGLARVAALRRRWRAGREGAPDLVHVTTPGPLGWAALRAARAEGIATSADFRTNFHAYSRHYGLAFMAPVVFAYLRRLHAMADCTFVPTRELARTLSAHGFERLQVVGRGVDAQRFSPARRDAELRHYWGAGDADPVLLHVGRVAPEKNVQLALDAFDALRRDVPRLRMVVVGDGPQRTRLQLAHPEVVFAGVQRGPELARHYASADLFLFPSLTDTFGNVVLEATASALSVVAFDTAAAGQHLRDGASGWLAPLPREGDAVSGLFVHAAQRALRGWLAGQPVGEQAQRVAQRADWDSVLQSFEQRLCRVAGARMRPLEHAALA